MEDLINLIIHSPLGYRLGAELAAQLANAGEDKPFKGGAVVFLEDEPARGIYLVVKGAVKLTRFSGDGRESVLHRAEAVQIIAEAAIFLGRYPASAIALEDSRLLFISREQVLELIATNGRFALFMFESMSVWLKRLVAKIENLTLADASARVARYLLSLYEAAPPGLSISAPRVRLVLKKGDIAALLNMHPPSLSRILRRLQDRGIIDVKRQTIVLLDVAALRHLALPPVG